MKLSHHFKYLEHRPKDEQRQEQREDRHIFTAERDHVTRREAVNDVMEHAHSRVAYHVVVLSPDPHEPVADLRSWTREVMRDFAEQQAKDVHWYAVQHHNTDHPHVHVVIAGGAEQADKERLVPVTIFRADLDRLHDSAFRHSDHELYQQLEEMHRNDLQELATIQRHDQRRTQHDDRTH